MKNIICLAFMMLAIVSCEKSKKIGFIDNGLVINDYQEKKDIEAKFQLKDDAFRKRTDSIGRAFQLEVQTTQSTAQNASQKRAQELINGLQQKQQQLQQQMQLEQQQLANAFQIEIDSVIVKVKNYVKEYGKTNTYTYILGTSDAAATVLYGTEDNNLTQIILDSLNKRYNKD